MTIADTLYDASLEIRNYVADDGGFEAHYGDLTPEILRVTAEMDALCLAIDKMSDPERMAYDKFVANQKAS